MWEGKTTINQSKIQPKTVTSSYTGACKNVGKNSTQNINLGCGLKHTVFYRNISFDLSGHLFVS